MNNIIIFLFDSWSSSHKKFAKTRNQKRNMLSARSNLSCNSNRLAVVFGFTKVTTDFFEKRSGNLHTSRIILIHANQNFMYALESYRKLTAKDKEQLPEKAKTPPNFH